jgi:hypothetical protein
MSRKASVPTTFTSDNGEAADFPFGDNAPADGEPAAEAPPAAAAATPTRPSAKFDPRAFRLADDKSELGAVEKQSAYSVQKPKKDDFFTVHPGPDMRIPCAVMELSSETGSGFYLLTEEIADELATDPAMSGLISFRDLLVCMHWTSREIFLWPLRRVDPHRADDKCNKSARDAAAAALTGWVRMAWNKRTMSYGKTIAKSTKYALPDWETELGGMNIYDLIEIAFSETYINSLDHPILKKLEGDD